MKTTKKHQKYQKGDKVVVLSMVSSTARRLTPIFTVVDYSESAGLYFLECHESNDNQLHCMRGEKCLKEPVRIRYMGQPLYVGTDYEISAGSLLTVSSETEEDYLCYETGNKPVPKIKSEKILLF